MEFYDELIKAHKRRKNASDKFNLLAKKVKAHMKDKGVSIWENKIGSILIKTTPTNVFKKDLLIKSGIDLKPFTVIEKRESFNVNHK